MSNIKLRSILHLATLEDMVLVDFLQEDESCVEMLARKKSSSKKVTITNPTGEIAISSVGNKKNAYRLAHRGSRWIGQKRNILSDGTKQWQTIYQDSPDGPIYEANISSHFFCPQDSDIIYGTSPMENRFDGAELQAWRHGHLLWAYRPEESVLWDFYDVGIRRLKAYPHQIQCSRDGCFLAFRFTEFLYFFNNKGFIRRWVASDLLDLVGISTTPEKLDKYKGKEEYGEGGTLEFEITGVRGQYPRPLIDSLWMPSGGNFVLVSIKNCLFWFNSEGQLVHHLQLSNVGPYSLTIYGEWFASCDDDCFVVSNKSKLSIIRNRSDVGNIDFSLKDHSTKQIIGYDTVHRIFAFRNYPNCTQFGLCSENGKTLIDGELSSYVHRIKMSPSGRYLAVSSREDVNVFSLEFLKGPQETVSFGISKTLKLKMPHEKKPPTFAHLEVTPDWKISSNNYLVTVSSNTRTSGRLGDNDITIFRDGKQAIVVTFDSCDFSAPHFEPNGKWFVYTQGSDDFWGRVSKNGLDTVSKSEANTTLIVQHIEGEIITRIPLKVGPCTGGSHIFWYLQDILSLPDGRLLVTCRWDTYKPGKQPTISFILNIDGSTANDEPSKDIISKARPLIDTPEPLYVEPMERYSEGFQAKGRLLEKLESPKWSFEANACIYECRLSPDDQFIGFPAGTKVWILTKDGKVVFSSRQKATKVWPDNTGGALCWDGKVGFSVLNSEGNVVGNCVLPGFSGRYIMQRENKLLFEIFDRQVNRLWMLDLTGKVLLRFSPDSGFSSDGIVWSPDGQFLFIPTNRAYYRL